MARRVLVTGGSGMIGQKICALLRAQGDDPVVLSRSHGPGRVVWDPARQVLDPAGLEEFDGVVHLAGASIAGVWTPAHKRAILESRRDGTRLLVDRLLAASAPPQVFVSASAVGYYGSRADQMLTESSSGGDGFLAEVVREWEAAVLPLRSGQTRTVRMRIGLVLDRDDGLLAKLLTPFKLGLGGRVGSGRQWWSWVTSEDVARAFVYALDEAELEGAYNLAAPQPVTNGEFTKMLGRTLRRPTIFPIPTPLARLAPGGMGDEVLLASQRASSERLRGTGFTFEDSELPAALARILGRTAAVVA